MALTSTIPAGASPRRPSVYWSKHSDTGIENVRIEACKVWPGNARDTIALSPPNVAELKACLLTVGQLVPVIARISTYRPDTLEIIAGACRWAAINQINEGLDDAAQMGVVVELRDVDDEQALKIVDTENRGRSALINTLSEVAPASASSIFTALAAAVAPPSDKYDGALEHNGTVVGSLRRGKAGMALKLFPAADDIQVMRTGVAMRPDRTSRSDHSSPVFRHRQGKWEVMMPPDLLLSKGATRSSRGDRSNCVPLPQSKQAFAKR